MEPTTTNIQAVRNQLVDRGLIFGSAIAPLALIVSSARICIIGWHPIHVFHAVLAVLVIASAVFRKRLPYAVRVCSMLVPVFLVGVVGLYVFGIAGSGILILFIFAIMVAIAFGTRAGLIACGVNMVVILGVGIAVFTGAITFYFDASAYIVSMASWISKLSIFYLFAPLTIIVFGVIYNHLVESLQKLEKSEKKYRRLFDSANDAIFLMREERYVDCNPKALEMFGATRDQIIGQTPYRFSPDRQPDGRESKQRVIKMISAALSGESMFFEWQHRRNDGNLFDAEVSLTDMSLDEDRYLLAIVRDITERRAAEEEKKQIEKQLQQAQRMEAIGTLAGGIAHDFNNILTSIMGFAYLLKKDIPEENRESMENIEAVMKAGQRAQGLVRHILTFSRNSESKKSPVVPAMLVKEVVKLLRATLPAAIDVRVDIRDDESAVYADATQIHQIVMNLGVNAAQAMKSDGGIMDIRVERVTLAPEDLPEFGEIAPGDFVRLTVSDTGHGIPKDIADWIFDPFFTTKKRGEGTGMGLSVVHGIVKGMGGSIQVKSEVGKGATFEVLLPVHAAGEKRAAATSLPSPSKGGGSILFVDDDASISNVAGKILKRLGYDVTSVTESSGALELFASNPLAYDLVITDLDMPGMNGLELSRKLRQKRPGVSIILCTGFSDNITSEELDDIGIYKMMMKPLILSELVANVEKALQ